MLALIAAVYLLLALRVRLQADAALCGAQSSLSLTAYAAGVELRFDGEIRCGEGGLFLKITPRYGVPLRFSGPAKVHVRRLRAATPYLLAAVRAGRFERIALHMRLGLEDAAETAVAAGMVRALVLSALSCLGCRADSDVRIAPDFGGAGVAAHARCIFSCQAGDIMFAVIKTAVRKTGKEGFGWKSIPLRA